MPYVSTFIFVWKNQTHLFLHFNCFIFSPKLAYFPLNIKVLHLHLWGSVLLGITNSNSFYMYWWLGAKRSIVLATCLLFGLSFTAVFLGIVPPFTEDTARAVNVSFQSHLLLFLFATYVVCFESSSCNLHCSHNLVDSASFTMLIYTHANIE